ncbi:LPS translocon maturation chaperone LptM [Kaarinaea lacus]
MRKKPFTILTYCLSAVIIALVLTGCGRKGGLYLPENVKADNEKTESTPAPSDDER